MLETKLWYNLFAIEIRQRENLICLKCANYIKVTSNSFYKLGILMKVLRIASNEANLMTAEEGIYSIKKSTNCVEIRLINFLETHHQLDPTTFQ